MRITILTVGSRGDVQPFLALGLGLERAGHRVRLATHLRFEPYVTRTGLEFAPLAEGRLSEGPTTEEGRRWLEGGSKRLPSWVGLLRDVQTIARERLSDAIAACTGADAVVTSDLATLLGWQMSEQLGLPLVRARLTQPMRLADATPGPIAATVRQAIWLAARAWLTAVRRDVGLSAPPRRDPLTTLDRRRALVVYALSPSVFGTVSGGAGWREVTGYWFLDRGLDPDPPAALTDFLASGAAPVCIGFGSMLDADPVATTAMAVDALRRAGRRGVLLRGQYGLQGTELSCDVIALDWVSHDWLFPRCAAIVHHASAGTTAAALRAGVPSVPIPHMSDQFKMARLVHQIGAGTAPIPRRRLSEQRLYEAISAATADATMHDRAAALGEQIRAEDGVGRAVTVIERYLRAAHVSERKRAAPPATQDHTDDQEVTTR
ncbi:MAG: glycosyltransferase [Solirubrobacteraceae bacterium]